VDSVTVPLRNKMMRMPPPLISRQHITHTLLLKHSLARVEVQL
jgi:hypothetical protein